MKSLLDAGVSFSRVSVAGLRKLERKLGALLPPKYLAFLEQRGVCSVIDARGEALARLLKPHEVLQRHAWSQEFVDEFSFGDEPEDRASALRELELRKRLIPFQYVARDSVSDFHCFDTGHRRRANVLIIDAFHDDFDLADWLLADSPDLSHCTFDFEKHLERTFRKVLDEQ